MLLSPALIPPLPLLLPLLHFPGSCSPVHSPHPFLPGPHVSVKVSLFSSSQACALTLSPPPLVPITAAGLQGLALITTLPLEANPTPLGLDLTLRFPDFAQEQVRGCVSEEV